MFDYFNQLDKTQRKILAGIILGILAAGIFIISVILIINDETNANREHETQIATEVQSETATSTEVVQNSESEEPSQTEEPSQSEELSQTEEPSQSEESEEPVEITLGIDVSKYQGTIDWKQVSESGVEFVMIRVGYRTMKTGEIIADKNAKYNMQEAGKYGIKVGAYFFSTAVSKEEAIEEADWVAEYISKYSITYPVVYNCEGFEKTDSRQYGLTKTQRTDIAITFLNRIAEKGYSPMFYASANELEAEAKWETTKIEGRYRIWVAQYVDKPYPETTKSTYSRTHDMWQYSNKGKVPGINASVDMNVAYFKIPTIADPMNPLPPEESDPDKEVLMNFKAVEETVTAKIETNLRDVPSQGEDSKIVYKLLNGDTAIRTGISDTGWSRVVYKGETYYALSSLLTTDLLYQQPEESENEIKTQFTAVEELVTAKEAVNLRTMPSVEHEDCEIIVQLQNGEVVKRTGINEEYGWSRVEYNGQILYCISSYLQLVEENTEIETQN